MARILLTAGGVVTSGAIAFSALMTAGAADEPAWGLRVTPFVAPTIIAVHVLSALPLATLLADWLVRRSASRWMLWALLGLAVALGTLAFGQEVGGQLEAGNAGLVARAV